MAVMEEDLVKKESFGVKLMDFQAHRQGGTLTRKHISPAFQPPLPPTDGSTLAPAGPEPSPQSSRAESSTGGGTVPSSTGILEQGPSPGNSPPRPKDTTPAPAPGRNSSQMAASQNQAPMAAGSHQLSFGPGHNSAGPSPHTLRRGKKPPLLLSLREGCADFLGLAQGFTLQDRFHVCYKMVSERGTCMASSEEHVTLDLGVASSSPALGVKSALKKKIFKKMASRKISHLRAKSLKRNEIMESRKAGI
ncbi:rho GTPase-activating protein 17-like [Ailuropoda melanoleuca]|uniref:rho GTPase-activating protein 17-like n=1 Tax=Ailuropoda melanoleuca TaxID=9646 RepID=UPI0014940194|nr:rho GTPase-activating protein 17-like [Ailuropoda melanoleuca]